MSARDCVWYFKVALCVHILFRVLSLVCWLCSPDLTQECWNPAIEELLEAAAGRIRAVVAFDFRGHGRSPPLELTEETFIDDDDATKTRSDSSSVRKRLKCAKWEKFAVEDTLAMVEVGRRRE